MAQPLPEPRCLMVPGAGVALGATPVTVAEFAPFVASGAYDDATWWSTTGWRWRTDRQIALPRGWAGQPARGTHPVVGVSWWAADAWCRWLDARTGRGYRLPTETEWLAAAGGGDAERYPWGPDPAPTSRHANFDRRLGGPCPVGRFPAGTGPYGHLDLAGNVWEWCADDPGADEAGFPQRPWRGASWARPAADLRVGVRHVARARCRGDYLGFRVARPLEDSGG